MWSQLPANVVPVEPECLQASQRWQVGVQGVNIVVPADYSRLIWKVVQVLPSSLKLSREDAGASSNIKDFSMSRNFQIHELLAHLENQCHKMTQGRGVYF